MYERMYAGNVCMHACVHMCVYDYVCMYERMHACMCLNVHEQTPCLFRKPTQILTENKKAFEHMISDGRRLISI